MRLQEGLLSLNVSMTKIRLADKRCKDSYDMDYQTLITGHAL